MTSTKPGKRGESMTIERLRSMLSAYGAAPSRWPHTERAAAEALIDSSPDARALVAEAAQMDALLDMVAPPAPSAALAERVRNRRFGWRGLRPVIYGERLSAVARRWMLSPAHQLAALAGMLLIGVLLGSVIPSGDSSPARAGIASAQYQPAEFVVEPTLSTGPPLAVLATAESAFSSAGDPSFDAPDPFGAAAHGLDLVDGARINSVPVPPPGEPLGSIPLL